MLNKEYKMSAANTRLARNLNLTDAVILGLGSMIGAGIFAATGPAAAAAGSGLLVGVLLAGWGFVIGKLASCTAMALTFAFYADPHFARPLAVSAVLILTFINYLGVRKTALVTKVLVGLVLLSLALVAFAALAGGGVEFGRLRGWTERGGVLGILQAAGMLFFAFAGYARVATLGEEVIEPKKTIPKAIVAALVITLFIYFTIFMTAVLTVDAESLANASAPLVLAVNSGRFSFLVPAVRVGACLASLGVLLSLMAGISRTVFSMSSNRDLPSFLSAVHHKHKVPHRAELAVGLTIASVVSFADLRGAIGFSSFAILIYYAIANIAALTLPKEQRLWPKWMSLLGCTICMLVAFCLPLRSVIGGLILFALGLLVFFFKHRNQEEARGIR
jgi:APA family basic amino acid/polyamine antiporter